MERYHITEEDTLVFGDRVDMLVILSLPRDKIQPAARVGRRETGWSNEYWKGLLMEEAEELYQMVVYLNAKAKLGLIPECPIQPEDITEDYILECLQAFWTCKNDELEEDSDTVSEPSDDGQGYLVGPPSDQGDWDGFYDDDGVGWFSDTIDEEDELGFSSGSTGVSLAMRCTDSTH